MDTYTVELFSLKGPHEGSMASTEVRAESRREALKKGGERLAKIYPDDHWEQVSAKAHNPFPGTRGKRG